MDKEIKKTQFASYQNKNDSSSFQDISHIAQEQFGFNNSGFSNSDFSLNLEKEKEYSLGGNNLSKESQNKFKNFIPKEKVLKNIEDNANLCKKFPTKKLSGNKKSWENNANDYIDSTEVKNMQIIEEES